MPPLVTPVAVTDQVALEASPLPRADLDTTICMAPPPAPWADEN